MKYILLLLTQFFLCSLQNDHKTLKVSVYYESLCPGSAWFITDQLYPAYSKIGSYLSIDLVPYGKATQELIHGKWKFKCQHGQPECVGNKYQACGLLRGKSQDEELQYVNCLMGSRNASSIDALENCVQKINATVADILKCSETGEGDETLAKYGDRTHKVEPRITSVPTIIFDDHLDPDIQNEIYGNFLKAACKALNNEPPSCQQN